MNTHETTVLKQRFKLAGWRVSEKTVHGDEPYNGRVVGWEITVNRAGKEVRAEAPFLTQAWAKIAEKVPEP